MSGISQYLDAVEDRLPRILKIARSGLRKEAEKKACEEITFYDVRNRAEFLKADLVIFMDDEPPYHAKCLKSRYDFNKDWPVTGQIGTKENPLPLPSII